MRPVARGAEKRTKDRRAPGLRGKLSSTGSVTVTLPSSSVANSTLPAIACYVSSDGKTWLAVAQTPSASGFVFCGLTGIATTSPGVTLINGLANEFYYIIATW